MGALTPLLRSSTTTIFRVAPQPRVFLFSGARSTADDGFAPGQWVLVDEPASTDKSGYAVPPGQARQAGRPGARPMLDTLLASYKNGYCEDLFARLAATAPAELVELLQADTLGVLDLSYGAEALGLGDDARAEGVLMGLVGHASAIVREGAMLGLYQLGRRRALDSATLERIRVVASGDSNEAVRDGAAEVLDLLT